MKYTATPRKDSFEGGFLGIFWASYIDGPQDKSIYFLDGDSRWVQLATQLHGRDKQRLLLSGYKKGAAPPESLLASQRRTG